MKKSYNLIKILGPYAKKNVWLALDSNRTKVVGEGVTFEEAVMKAKEKNIKNPTLIKSAPSYSGFVTLADYEI